MPDRPLTIPIPFPHLGLDRGSPAADQPKFTTHDLLNVRSMHYGDARGGGKRDGLTKAFATQLGVEPALAEVDSLTGQSAESTWRRINHLNLFIATSTGVVVPCEQVDLSTGFNLAGTRMLEEPEGTLNVVGDMTTVDGVVLASANQRFAIWDTDDEAWTAPGGFDQASDNPAGLIMFNGTMYCAGGSNTAAKNRFFSRSGTSWTNLSINATTTGFTAGAAGTNNLTGGTAALYCLCEYNGELYIGGRFAAANGTTAANICKYGGSAGVFTAVGGGVSRAFVNNASIFHMEVFNGKLYVAGLFTTANGTSLTTTNIAAWDGSNWSVVTDGTNVGVGLANTVAQAVQCLRSWNGKLYIGGKFSQLATTTASGHYLICSWNGTAYGKLVWGLNDRGGSSVQQNGVKAMEVYDDGTGEKLWCFGQFNAVSTTDNQGLAACNMASWDGAQWGVTNVGVNATAGVTGGIRHGLGAGTTNPKKLYLVGAFTRKNVKAAGGLASFDGSDIEALGGGAACGIATGSLLPGSLAGGKSALAAGTLANDPVERLYAAIDQSGTGGGTSCRYGYGPTAIQANLGVLSVERGNQVWSKLKVGSDELNVSVYALKIWNGRLYIGGNFTASGTVSAKFTAWNGSSFEPITSTPNAQVIALESSDDTTVGTGIFVASSGAMGGLGSPDGAYIARWDGAAWHLVGTGANSGGVSSLITCIKYFDGKIYAGGDFTTIKGVAAKRIGVWNGTAWTFVGGGVDGGFSGGVVSDLCVYNNELYAVGTFTATADGTTVNGIARYDAASATWKALGTGLALTSGILHGQSLYSWGGFLFIGGRFDSCNGVTIRCLAKWDGSAFMPVDTTEIAGIHSVDGTDHADVQAMCDFDDRLVFTGQFDYLGGSPATFITAHDCT